MKIILLGYMGSGKTGVGKLLSEKMRLPFLDLDDQISLSEKKEIPEIFESSGEIYFRKKESAVLKELLNDENDEFILSLGGGTPCYGNNLEFMKQRKDVRLVYLKTSLAELKRRLFQERSSRPLIHHLATEELLEDFIGKHLFERTFYYNQSDFIIETDSKSMAEISNEIMGKLK